MNEKQIPDEIYSYGLAFIAERTGKIINMFENLIWKDQLVFKTEEEAVAQMKVWENIGNKVDKMKLS